MVQAVGGGTTEPDVPILPPRHHRHHSHKLTQVCKQRRLITKGSGTQSNPSEKEYSNAFVPQNTIAFLIFLIHIMHV